LKKTSSKLNRAVETAALLPGLEMAAHNAVSGLNEIRALLQLHPWHLDTGAPARLRSSAAAGQAVAEKVKALAAFRIATVKAAGVKTKAATPTRKEVSKAKRKLARRAFLQDSPPVTTRE
jgi:hypothetical protein